MLDANHSDQYDQILQDLLDCGYAVSSIMGLANNYRNYQAAIPVLLGWLTRVDDLATKEAIVRVMAVRYAKPAARTLINEFKAYAAQNPSGYGWALGNTLSVIADDSIYEDIARLVVDKKYSIARQMLVIALGKMKNPESVNLLIELLNDEEITGHAIISLRKRNAIGSRPFVEPFLEHPNTWWRNEAKKTLEKFDETAKSERKVIGVIGLIDDPKQ